MNPPPSARSALPWLSLRVQVPLDSFDLRVDVDLPNRVSGIFGPSGSGKTTLIEAIAGLRRNVRGRIGNRTVTWLDSDRGIRVPPWSRKIGYVPQDHRIFPHWTVERNLRSGRHQEGNGKLLRDVVETLELQPLLHRRPEKLSGGERQRVALGRALASGPEVLLLDEPLASLDGRLRERILPFLIRIRDRFDLPILVVSHNPIEIQALCDEVLMLKEGRVVDRAPPEELFFRDLPHRDEGGPPATNCLRARLILTGNGRSVVRLGSKPGGAEVEIPPVQGNPGDTVLLRMDASDLLIATEPVGGLSARNGLAGVIEKIQSAGPLVRIQTSLDQHPTIRLTAEVTHATLRDLDLVVGRRIGLVFKSTAVRPMGFLPLPGDRGTLENE